MRSSKYSKAEFFDKMKKKPELQKVLDNIESYTSDDIDALAGGCFPKWVKDCLKEKTRVRDEYIARGNRTAEEVAMECAAQMLEASAKLHQKRSGRS